MFHKQVLRYKTEINAGQFKSRLNIVHDIINLRVESQLLMPVVDIVA